jgi:hypothetical protein
MKTISRISATLALLAAAASLGALELAVSPNLDGTLDLEAAHSWNYGPSLFSGFALSSRGSVEKEEEDGLYYVTTGREYELRLDALGYRAVLGSLGLELRASGRWQRFDYRDDGYYSGTGYLAFFDNQRRIGALMPELGAGLRLKPLPGLALDLKAAWSPWARESFDQSLMAQSNDGAHSFPARSLDFAGSTTNLLSGEAGFRLSLGAVELRGFALADRERIAYDCLDAYGDAARVDATLTSLKVDGELSLGFLAWNGLRPKLLVGYAWDWTDNQGGGSASSGKWSVGLGLD